MQKEVDLLVKKMDDIQMFHIVPNRVAQDYFANPDIVLKENPLSPPFSSSEPDDEEAIVDDEAEYEDLQSFIDPNLDTTNLSLEQIAELNSQTEKEAKDESQKKSKEVKLIGNFEKFLNLEKQGKKKIVSYYINKLVYVGNFNTPLSNFLLLFSDRITSEDITKAVQWLRNASSEGGTETFRQLCSFFSWEIPSSILL